MLRLLIAVGVFLLAAWSPPGARADVSDLVDRVTEPARKAAGERGALAPREDELPWCVSADDPRCSPLDPSSAPIGADLRVAAGVVGDAPAPSASPKQAQEFTPCVGLVAHVGISHRVERPPRAN